MKTLILLVLLLPTVSNSQKLKVNEVDKFTKKKTLKTNDGTLKMGFSEVLTFNIRTVDSTVFIMFLGAGPGAEVIGAEDNVILLLNDQSTITLKSTGIQTYIPERTQNKFHHQYYSSIGDLKKLKESKVLSVRKYTPKGYNDMDVPEKNQDVLSKYAALILENL